MLRKIDPASYALALKALRSSKDADDSAQEAHDDIERLREIVAILPPGGEDNDLLGMSDDGSLKWITPADKSEQDNTNPITSAAVYTEIGNINALLATI